MTKTFVAELHGPLSHVRLETYREAGGSDLAMVTNYFWYVRLAESLVPVLHAVEIALRNSIHAALSDRFDTDMWFYQDGLLRANQLRDFASAMGKIANKPTPLAGRIVAQLSFNFWTSLLNSPYEQQLWLPNKSALLFTVFPNAIGHSRKEIEARFTMINALRNRAFHYEPIWNDQELLHKHAAMHEAIRWMSLPLLEAIQSIDLFLTTYHGRSSFEDQMSKLLLGVRSTNQSRAAGETPIYNANDYLGVP